MNKSIITLCAALMLGTAAHAQVSYGLKAGLNLATFSGDELGLSENQTNNMLYHVSGYFDIPVQKQFSVQAGLSLQGKGDKYKFDMLGANGDVSFNLMSIELPVNFVYNVPAGPGNVFLGAGPYAGYIVKAQAKATGDAFITVNGSDVQLKSKDLKLTGDDRDINPFDAGLNFLLGYKFNNGFLINAGYGLGLTNLSRSTVDKTSTRVFNVGIGFQM